MSDYERDFYNQMTEAVHESIEELTYQVCELVEINNASLKQVVKLLEQILEENKDS